MNAATLINQTSGNVEWYTPSAIVEAARQVMGSIDLDPASSTSANETIRAARIFAEADDGLSQFWCGNVWMNHPFGRATNRRWIAKLVEEYRSERVQQACCITFASTSEGWFQPLLDFPICFIRGRVRYLDPIHVEANAPPKGSVVAYLGPNVERFIEVFENLGRVMVPA